jgi:hypothetical protein
VVSIGLTTSKTSQEKAIPEITEKSRMLSMFLPENGEFNSSHP